MRLLAFLAVISFSFLATSKVTVQTNELIELTSTNTVNLSGEITTASVSDAYADLLGKVIQRGVSNYTIYLVIDSPGGNIVAGEDFITFSKVFKNVKTISLFAASMASAIVQGMPGERLILDNSIHMYHRAAGGIQGQMEDGEMESRLNLYKTIVRNMEQRNADRMHIPLQTYKDAVKDELWMYGKNSLYHSSDRIVEVVCSKELLKQKETKVVAFGFFSIKATFSKCPLIKGGVASSDSSKDLVEKWETYQRSSLSSRVK